MLLGRFKNSILKLSTLDEKFESNIDFEDFNVESLVGADKDYANLAYNLN